MSKAAIKKLSAAGICDIYMCSNIAEHGIGYGEGGFIPQFNICNECLEMLFPGISEILNKGGDEAEALKARIAELEEAIKVEASKAATEPVVENIPVYGVSPIENLVVAQKEVNEAMAATIEDAATLGLAVPDPDPDESTVDVEQVAVNESTAPIGGYTKEYLSTLEVTALKEIATSLGKNPIGSAETLINRILTATTGA